jgi:hypothetical protein
MKKAAIFFLAAAMTAFASPSYCADWFRDIATNMGRLEGADATNIYLVRPWSSPGVITKTGISGEQCTFNQVQFVAPTPELRKEWMALLLMAIAADRRVDAFGACNSNTTLVVSRLVISYD